MRSLKRGEPMRVLNYLADQEVLYDAVHHAPAFSAQKRAERLHLTGRQVAKCVLLSVPHGFLLAVLPACRRIDLNLLERQLRTPVRLATDEELASVFNDCEWGVVPPFGTLYGISTVLDDSLANEEHIVVEGHLHVQAIRMRRIDFERLEKPRRLRFAVTQW